MRHILKKTLVSPRGSIAGLLTAILGGLSAFGCANDDADPTPVATLGALNINVSPTSADVVVTGPANYSKSFSGNQLLVNLAPGTYAATANAPGYTEGTSQINVVAGQTSSISLTLPSLATSATFGSLNVNVRPENAVVIVDGPGGYTQTFTGNRLIAELTPGEYTVSASSPGYGNGSTQINVVAGVTSSISLALQLPVVTSPSGSLIVNVNPSSATVVVKGPGDFVQTFTGNHFITDLPAGQYTATASAPGFVDATGQVNVILGYTSTIAIVLDPRAIIAEAPRAVYRDGAGNLISLDASSLQSGKFVFYAWLNDEDGGLNTAKLRANAVTDPGKPLVSEQKETAPSFSQNLAGAWVGYTDAAGIVRPVIGADVRWEIDQQYSGRLNSMQFGTSDDNRQALGYGVFDDQADTRTNNARLSAEGFPLLASEYPLFNQTGIGTPFTDGFTWVTLFSPDAAASGRIVAVATINGEEIGKQILFKNFAPSPFILITKKVSADVVNLVGGSATVTWTVNVKNVGTGNAANVDLTDALASGPGASYSLSGLPEGATAVGDGFTMSFPLASEFAPSSSESGQLLGSAWSFAVLANLLAPSGPSVISGDVGVTGSAAITGFPPSVVLNGSLHSNDAAAQAAKSAVTNAYADLGARACTGAANAPLGGHTFLPGVYCYDAAANLTGAVVLDAKGDPDAEFVFRITGALTTAAGASVSLVNGANSCNVYWQVGGLVMFGGSTFFVGSILAQTNITAAKGASVTGRLLARTGTATLDTNVINAPLSCAAAPGTGKTLTFTATVTEPGTYCNLGKVIAYGDSNAEWTPSDVWAQACFTALESNISIIKDFVADDLTTSLGKTKTVGASVAAKLRVRVVNGGTGTASGVVIRDVLSSGDASKYQLISVTNGTPNATDGFDTTVGDLAAGATMTLFLNVSASADGTYCDTASVTATSGTIGIGSDTACLTVATPNLTITKTNSPDSVLPGGNYTSTITVHNTGNSPANNVVISDLLGLNTDANIRVIYVSSSLGGVAGVIANNTVTAGAITLAANATVTFTVVSRVPLGAIAGAYCDIATVTSSDVPTKQASDCIDVPAFSALQTQLVDLQDPVNVGGTVIYFSIIFSEAASNEGVSKNVLTYSFGLNSPTGLGTAGAFRIATTKVYFDSAPVRDPQTGFVVSDTSNPTAVLLAAPGDYTINDTTGGLEVITIDPTFVLDPNTAIYVVQTVTVPAGTPANRLYTTGYLWDSAGPLNPYRASSSEPTTVIP